MKAILPTVLTALTLVIAGCTAESVAGRIKSRPDHYATYPADVQERIARGQIRIGDDAEAVWYVYGEPSRKTRSVTENGTVETWTYRILGYTDSLYPTVRPVTVVGRRGGSYTSYYIDNTPYYEWQDVLSIDLRDSKVTAVRMVE